MTDDYPTCAETYVTLRVYHETVNPAVVSEFLGLTPTSSKTAGASYEYDGRTKTHKLSGWFLCSKNSVESYDSEKHLDWLLSTIQPLHDRMGKLREQGWRFDISCLWDSDLGHGGPTLSPALLSRLAEAGIELWFDVYFHGAYLRIRDEKGVQAIAP